MLSHHRMKGFDLVGQMDLNQAQNPDNYCLVRVFVFKVVRETVTWLSKKQLTVATFSVKAEYCYSNHQSQKTDSVTK